MASIAACLRRANSELMALRMFVSCALRRNPRRSSSERPASAFMSTAGASARGATVGGAVSGSTAGVDPESTARAATLDSTPSAGLMPIASDGLMVSRIGVTSVMSPDCSRCIRAFRSAAVVAVPSGLTTIDGAGSASGAMPSGGAPGSAGGCVGSIGDSFAPRVSAPPPAPIRPPASRPIAAALPMPSVTGLSRAMFCRPVSANDCGTSSNKPSLIAPLPMRWVSPSTPGLIPA